MNGWVDEWMIVLGAYGPHDIRNPFSHTIPPHPIIHPSIPLPFGGGPPQPSIAGYSLDAGSIRLESESESVIRVSEQADKR